MIADAPYNLAADPAALIATQLAGKPVTLAVLNQTAFQRLVQVEIPSEPHPDSVVGLATVGGDTITLPGWVNAGLYDTDPNMVGYSANILAHEIGHIEGILNERETELHARATEYRVIWMLGLRGYSLRVAESEADWQSAHSPNLKR